MRAEYLADFEQYVLAEMIRQPKSCALALTKVSAEDFSSPQREIFETISKMHSQGAAVSPLTLTAELGDVYRSYLEELYAYSTGGDVEYYCAVLRDASRLKAAQLLAMQVSTAGSIAEAEGAISQMAALLNSRQRMARKDALTAANAFMDRMTESSKTEYLNWGLKILDRELYAEAGDFIVLGGYPSAGKTALACQMALTQAAKYRVGFFSLETRESKLTDRLMCCLSGVELPKIKNKALSNSDFEALTHAAEKLSKLELHIYEASSGTPQSIFAEAIAQRLQVIYIDYLQLLTPAHSRNGNRYEEVTAVSRDLHILSQTHGITVVALAQLARPERTANNQKKQPNMNSFKESGQIEQDADAGILIYQADDADYQSRRILKIAKNKEGRRERTELEFDGARQRFTEDRHDGAAYWEESRGKKENQQIKWEELPGGGEMPF